MNEPVNAEERYMHAVILRLDALVEMMSSFITTYAEINKVAITENKVIDESPKRTRKK